MIVSSRETVTDFGIETKLHLLPLNDAQAKTLATHRLGSESAARQLLDDLPDRLHDFTERPLLLNMLCSVYQKAHAIPQNQGELFRRFTHDEYAKHKPSGTVATRENTFFDFCDEILQEVAFLMMHAEGDGKNLWLQVPLVDAEKWLEKRFGERGEANAASKAKQWLSDALNFHLLQPAADHGKIEFIHQTFQEYYAAEWLLRHFDELTDDQLCVHYLNPIKWTESLLMLAGMLSDKTRVEHFLELLLKINFALASEISGALSSNLQDFSFNFILNFLVKNGIEVKELHSILKKNKTESSAIFFAEFLRSKDEDTLMYYDWIDYIDHLIGINCDASKSYLKWIINEKENFRDINNREKVREAISGLAKLHEIEALVDFISRNAGDDWEIDCAINHIKEVSDERKITLLLNWLHKSNTPDKLRDSITVALGNINTTQSSNILIDLLTDQDIKIRATACRMLEKSNNPKATEPLLHYLYNPENTEIQSAALFLKSNAPEYARILIERRLKEKIKFTRNIAFRFLFDVYEGGYWKIFRFLGEFHSKFIDFIFEEVTYIGALMYLESQKSLQLLMNCCDDKEWVVRSASVSALGYIGSESAIQLLIKKLDDNHDAVRSSAIKALAMISHPIATRAVFDQLFPSKANGMGISGLWDIMYQMMSFEKYSEEFIYYALTFKNYKVRQVVIKVLRDNPIAVDGKSRIINLLFECAKNTDKDISHLAIAALSRIKVEFLTENIRSHIERVSEKKYGKTLSKQRKEQRNTKSYHSDQWINKVFNIDSTPLPKELNINLTKEKNVKQIFNFNAPVGFVGDNHATVNVGNNQPTLTLSAEDITALRTFLQTWSQHQKSKITENPESSGIDAMITLEAENPGLMQRIQNGGIGALTSLIGDMATGEDPISAFIKAFIAGIGGAATRP
jgi:HEAT repeat protein